MTETATVRVNVSTHKIPPSRSTSRPHRPGKLARTRNNTLLQQDPAAVRALLPELVQEAAAWQPLAMREQTASAAAQSQPQQPPVSPQDSDADMDIDTEPPPARTPPLPEHTSAHPLPSPSAGPFPEASAGPAAAPVSGAAGLQSDRGIEDIFAAAAAAQPTPEPEAPKRPRTVLAARPVYADPLPAPRAISPPVRLPRSS